LSFSARSAARRVDPPYHVFDAGFLDGQVEHFRKTVGSACVGSNPSPAAAPLSPEALGLERTFAWGTHARVRHRVRAVEPLVVAGEAAASVEAGVLRHAARLRRARPDLGIDELGGG
jgi:hypothetical protein